MKSKYTPISKIDNSINLIDKCVELCKLYNLPLNNFGLDTYNDNLNTIKDIVKEFEDIQLDKDDLKEMNKTLDYYVKHYTELYTQLSNIAQFVDIVNKN